MMNANLDDVEHDKASITSCNGLEKTITDTSEDIVDADRRAAMAEADDPTPRQLESGPEMIPTETAEGGHDLYLVEFDGPDDVTNPKNWSFKRRWLVTGLVSLFTFMTPLASSMIAPAETYIDESLGVHSTIETELIFSIFLLAFVIGPFVVAPMSELYGRLIVLQIANAFFLIFNLACGFAQNGGEMIAFRFLSGLGACAPQTLGGGVLSDIWKSEERGTAMALYSLAPLLGPALGPLIGAWIAVRTTWRWSFWAVTIFGVAVQVLIFFTLEETYTPRILQRKAQKLRRETGDEGWHTRWEGDDRRLHVVMKNALKRVFVLLGTQPIVQFLGKFAMVLKISDQKTLTSSKALFMSIIYGIVYLILATFPNVWTDIYHESTGIGGLNYISLMIGLTVGAQVAGRVLDKLYKHLKSRDPSGEGKPEHRVPMLFFAIPVLAGGLFMYGWSAQTHTFWLVPNIGVAIFALGMVMIFTTLQLYIVDSYQLYAASAIGATAAARSLTGFGFPLFADYMFDAVGYGWGNSILAFAVLGIGTAGSLTLWFKGEALRKMSRFAADPR